MIRVCIMMHVLIYYQLFKQIYKQRKEETIGLKYKSFINRMVAKLAFRTVHYTFKH